MALFVFGLSEAAGASSRMAAVFLVGAALGAVLLSTTFGFAGAYRRFLLLGDGRGIGAQLLMIALGTALIAPTLALAPRLGLDLAAAGAPLGVQVLVGAALFGVGMQLGGGCASGTLFALGAGRLSLLATLLAFCTGAFVASLHLDRWTALPRLPETLLSDRLGWPAAVVLQLFVICGLYLALCRLHRAPAPPADGEAMRVPARLRIGPRLAWGAAALAVLNWLTLLVAGHPWAVTWGLTLWGAKLATAVGWSPPATSLWASGYPARALHGGLFADTVSTMDFAVVSGALLASAIAGRFRPTARLSARSLAAAVAGGLLMGYGARIAFGCNIGAFFSGVSSTSLHGWAWIVAALAGNWLGVRLRPWFGLDVRTPPVRAALRDSGIVGRS
ncbi:hypothetical protein SAMN06265365_1674 [Tistlia consotensis]|uniref:Uncharacterized protein n=1 Tax=Tistlia consotensis USBA 355 TaxID=560819 RepID=A0A1Y6CY07_9PROT|nr:YeeE/YedE family protein [Tistlia consotensis]SMF85586.1 hypothetical protein SAMN05428998_1664 [Tistlia consotensis USBA 355]SNS40247.1 hypothetical protein SAMN06265365_1674 [Tistlia consotensis]